MRKFLENGLKILISVLILFFIVRQMDLQSFVRYILKMNIYYFVIGVVFMFLGYLFSAFRWYVFILAYELNLGVFRAFKIVLISLTAGLVLPSGAGPDLVRFYYAQRDNRTKRAEVLSSIFMDRFMGVITLSILAFLGLKVGVEAFQEVSSVITIALIVLFLVFAFFISGGFNFVLLKLLGSVEKFRIGERVRKFTSAFSMYMRNRKILVVAILISAFMQLLFGTGNYFIAKGLGLDVEFYKIVFITLTVNFITMLPISFSGIGIREGSFVFFLGKSVGNEAAFALSVLYYVASILAFSPGLLFVLKEPLKLNSKGMGDE